MLAHKLEVEALTELLKALADETRLRMVALLSHGELCVCHVQDALELSQSNTSRHLAILKNARVVRQRRDGNWMYYALAEQDDAARERLLSTVVAGFAKQDQLRRDIARLTKVRGPGACT